MTKKHESITQAASSEEIENQRAIALSHSSRKRKSPFTRKRLLLGLLLSLLLIYLGVILYHTNKPLPEGLSYEGAEWRTDKVSFISDLTYQEPNGMVYEHAIFDRILKAVREAEQFIVIDMFLFNSWHHEDIHPPEMAKPLTNALLEKKKANPELPIVFLTDEVNTEYGSNPAPELIEMIDAGITVAVTNTTSLRDSTPLYSGVWRMFIQWFGEAGTGWLPNAMAETAPKITARSYLKMLNVKANHRKVIVTEKTVIIPSLNIHDASAYNSNTAIETSARGVIEDILRTEEAAARLAGNVPIPKLPDSASNKQEDGQYSVQVLTEGAVYRQLLQSIDQAGSGDTLWMGMFYLADRTVLDSLLAASERGTEVRLILDPNQNAFGRDKIGLPNRPVAKELRQKSEERIQIRWYNTAEEQYHSKLMLILGKEESVIHNGSTNFTKRNLDDLNLETNLMVKAPADSELSKETEAYFDRLWNNEGAEFTLDADAYDDKLVGIKKVIYRLQTWLGFTTF